ncbi:MAG: tetratricopeptide repeat protein [Promethearchaeota archaeon]
MVESFNYPAKEILKSFKKNNEFLILWMLNNNELSTWSDLVKMINKSTLSNYLNRLLNENQVEKLSKVINGRKRNVYQINSKGRDRFYELSQGAKKKRLSYPPEAILRKREYKDWILWMVYNNNSCKWVDFSSEPLNINQSSLSKTMHILMDKKGFIKKENKEYKITKVGKAEYANMLRQYDLDRQSILEAESNRIKEITKKTNEFFDRFQIKDGNIKFRYLNNVIKLPYENEKIKYTLDNEEDFNKVLLFLSLNHPVEYPQYISPQDFSEKFDINLTKLNFAIIRIVEDTIYPIKFFKLEVESDICYYFQVNEKLEKMLNAIVEEHVAKSTYLHNLSESSSQLTLELTIEDILDEICGTLFSKNLRSTLKKFLPNYIQYLAYKFEKEKKIIDTFDKLEGLIWRDIQVVNQEITKENESNSEELLKAIDKAIKLNPKEIELYYSKSKVLINANMDSEALVLLDKILQNFPDDEKDIQIKRAYVFKEMRNLEAGLEIINQLLEKYPEDNDLLNYKACWLQYLNRKEESLEIVQGLLKREPANAIYHDSYGEILMFFKEYNQAIEEFSTTMKLGRGQWYLYQTYFKIAICYKEIEEYQLAIEYLNKGKEYTDKVISDSDEKIKWIAIANLFLAEIEQIIPEFK